MFEHPIKNPKEIKFLPLTITQVLALDPTPKITVLLALHTLETAWVIHVEHPNGEFAISNPRGTEVRKYRTIRVLREALRDLGVQNIDIPVNSEMMRQHIQFIEERQTWIQAQMRKHKLTNVSIGDAVKQPNGYVSQAINGIGHFPEIERYIAEKIGMDVEAIFPAVPDQIM